MSKHIIELPISPWVGCLRLEFAADIPADHPAIAEIQCHLESIRLLSQRLEEYSAGQPVKYYDYRPACPTMPVGLLGQ